MKRLLRMMEPAKRDVRMVRGMELYVAPDKKCAGADWIPYYRVSRKVWVLVWMHMSRMGRVAF